MPLTTWFLTAPERDNDVSDIPAWTSGNTTEPLIHGSTYFDRLVAAVEAMSEGDHLFFTDWRGNPDERLRPAGTQPCATAAATTPTTAATRGSCGCPTGTARTRPGTTCSSS
ncbi:hypothetical protein Psuf_008450 [Phytohabitans suffuscus]|uniref:Uncharacterized protein n=1 Tax=Phytohabitans suffuscus TaxID=624315 RepID=A0A6F8YBP7_9ACTN|nr:hypothetical protein Psuf_008450 [Phytohabitans suffuscus]